MLIRSLLFAWLLVACRDGDPGFEVVKVPLSAYASPDGSLKNDAGETVTSDAGPDPMVLCVPKPETKEDEETNSDDCPTEYQNRAYDEKATARHRKVGDDSTVCCYRKGRLPRHTTPEVE